MKIMTWLCRFDFSNGTNSGIQTGTLLGAIKSKIYKICHPIKGRVRGMSRKRGPFSK